MGYTNIQSSQYTPLTAAGAGGNILVQQEEEDYIRDQQEQVDNALDQQEKDNLGDQQEQMN